MELQYNLVVSEAALFEFNESFQYYETQKTGLGKEFAKIIDNSFNLIINNPLANKKLKKEIRIFIVEKFPFVIHYKVIEKSKEIIVISVFHTSRNPIIWKKRV